MNAKSFMGWRKLLPSTFIRTRLVINWCAILESRMMELRNRWASNLPLWTRSTGRKLTTIIVHTLLIYNDQSTFRLITTLMMNANSKSRRNKPTISLPVSTKVVLILAELLTQHMLSLENLASSTRKDKNLSFSRVPTLSSRTTSRTMDRDFKLWVL